MSSFSVIIPAAGGSQRFRDEHYKKPFIPLGERAVWLHAAEKFINRDDVQQVIVVISPDDKEMFQNKFSANAAILGIEVALGGDQRADSVQNGLAMVKTDVTHVAIHDAARPCIANQWIDNVFAAAENDGAAILATPVTSTLKRVNDSKHVVETVPRDDLWAAQTPQVFRKQLLLDAYAARPVDNPTDEASLVEAFGHAVTVVEGSPINIKITTKQDLNIAAQLLKALPKPKLLGPAHPFQDDHLWR